MKRERRFFEIFFLHLPIASSSPYLLVGKGANRLRRIENCGFPGRFDIAGQLRL